MRRDFFGFLVFFLVFYHVNGARILASVFSPSYSHQACFMPIWHELAKRGHEIVLITTDPVKNATLRQIDTSYSYKIMEERGLMNTVSNQNVSRTQGVSSYIEGLHVISDYQFGHPEVKALIQNKSEYFDLLMIEVIFPGQMAFVDRFNAPFIGLVSLDAPPSIHRAVGNPTHPILYPDTILPFTNNLTFLQRIISFLVNFVSYIFTNFKFYPREDENVKKHFQGFDIRPLSDIENDMDLLFINLNPIFHQIRPLGPNTIQIGGGIHIKNSKPLPNDIKNFLDKSTFGVIYFSLGTNVKATLIDPTLKSTIIKTLGDLPYDILWKYEDKIENLPKNIKISKWIPQQDVFRHQNVKLFITQCGLQSTEEAISNGIPILGMPFFGDQNKNAKIIKEKGLGLSVDKNNLTSEAFKATILEVINTPKYKENVIKMAELMEDIEFTGLEKAVWWTEFALRHNGAKHLRSSGMRDPFYYYFMLDVLLFVVVVLFTIIVINFYVVKFLFGKLFGRKNVDVKKKKN